MKITFLFNFLRQTEEVETIGKNGGAKQSYLATPGEDIRETHTILAYFLLTRYAHV